MKLETSVNIKKMTIVEIMLSIKFLITQDYLCRGILSALSVYQKVKESDQSDAIACENHKYCFIPSKSNYLNITDKLCFFYYMHPFFFSFQSSIHLITLSHLLF